MSENGPEDFQALGHVVLLRFELIPLRTMSIASKYQSGSILRYFTGCSQHLVLRVFGFHESPSRKYVRLLSVFWVDEWNAIASSIAVKANFYIWTKSFFVDDPRSIPGLILPCKGWGTGERKEGDRWKGPGERLGAPKLLLMSNRKTKAKGGLASKINKRWEGFCA
jgi:hypothetical protein